MGHPLSADRRTLPISTALGLLAVVLLILLNGFFVAAEFALVAVDRSRVDNLAEQGGRRARTAQGLLRHLSFHLSGAQLGITVTSLLIGILAEPAIATLLEPALEPLVGETAVRGVSLAVAIFLATIVQMVVGELVPKGLAIARPETTTFLLAPVVRVYGLVFGPAIRFLNGSANRTVRLLGVEPKEELSNVGTLSELQFLVQASAAQGTLDDSASTIIDGDLLLPHLWTGITKVRSGAGVAVVGDPQQCADTLQKFIDVGCHSFCLSGYPHDEEAEIFGRAVLPLLQARNKERMAA